MSTIRREQFSVMCDDSLTPQGEWLADTIASRKKQASGIGEGVTIQIGWSILKLIDFDNELILCEPDFSNNPLLDFRPDVTTTLLVLNSQNEIISKLKCEAIDARFDDKIVFLKDCLNIDRISMHRLPPKEGDSGWYISPVDSTDTPMLEELDAVYLWQLLTIRPKLLSVLLLPVDWLVIWNGMEIEAVIDGNNQNVWR